MQILRHLDGLSLWLLLQVKGKPAVFQNQNNNHIIRHQQLIFFPYNIFKI